MKNQKLKIGIDIETATHTATAAAEEPKNKFFATAEQAEVKNYPYGRLRTSCFFGTEWKPGKGFRTTKQTINPKTGRINKPKKSTYLPLILMYQTPAGKIDYIYCRWYDKKSNRQFLSLLDEHFRILTPEQVEDLALYIISMTKVDFIATLQYTIPPEQHEATTEKLKEIYREPLEILVDIAKNKVNRFGEVYNKLDFEAIEALKVEDYNPFTIRK